MKDLQPPVGSVPTNPSPDFWRGRRVFLTGHPGFKGSWLSLWLEHLGARVTGYALAPPTQPNLFTLARIRGGMDSVIADIRDLPRLQEALRQANPEIVFHLAAQPLVRHGYRHPVDTYATNVMGTVHLLEAIRHSPGVRAVVIVTSDKCYHNQEWVWGYRENEPMGGRDPYSSSKGCAELVTAAYRDAFFNAADYPRHLVAIASARAGNVIGGGDWAEDRLIPDLLRAFERGQTPVIRAPQAIRPWQHVLEPLAGYLLLAERLTTDGPAYGEAWNFGPTEDDAQPVHSVIEHLRAAWRQGGSEPPPWHFDRQPQPHEAHHLKLDCAKARSRLGWQPRWHLREAIHRIAAWHLDYLGGANMRNRSIADIFDYEQDRPIHV